MHLGLCLDPGRPWSDVATVARSAEASGWRSVYVCDHFMPAPGSADPDAAMLEGWTVLSALAACTERVRLGTLVLGSAYRHPAVVANMAATLDQVSAGRTVLGVGAGWQANEHDAYGMPLLDVGARLDRFAEACEVTARLLRDPPVSFSGVYYQLSAAPCDPRPVQRRLPLLVGGGGERRTLRIAAEWADEWHHWATPSQFRHKLEVLQRHCEQVGRDPAELRGHSGQVVRLTDRAGQLSVEPGSADVIGTLEEVTAQLLDYRAAGVDEFIVRDSALVGLPEMIHMIEALGTQAGDLAVRD